MAFALNAASVVGADASLLLAAVVTGTIGSRVRRDPPAASERGRVRRLLALALVVVAMASVRELGIQATTGSAATALALGFALMGASVTGDALRRFHLPRVTGYLLFGVLVGPSLGNLITESMAAQLQVVTGIATTLIALIAGLTLSVERLGSRLAAIVRMTAATLAVAMAGLSALAWLAWPWLPIAPDAVGSQRLVMLGLLVVMVVSFSPTMTAAVVADSGARGRLSDTVLAIVVLADLVMLVLFSLSMQLARVVFDTGEGGGVEVLARLAWEIGGAVAFGVLVGVLFALYLRYIGREITLVLLAVCAVLSQVGTTQQLQPLLAALAAGVVIENLAVAQGDTLRAAVRRGAPPVLVVFFVAVGASLRLDAVAVDRHSAPSRLSAVRLGFIRLGVAAGVKLSGLPEPIGSHAWTGLVSQAGITLGFASVVATEFPGWGNQLQLLLVASIAIHELVGPILFRRGLVQAGELDPHVPRPLIVVSNREPYLHSQDEDGRHCGEGRDGWCRGGARRADARTRRRLDRARRRRPRTGWSSTPATRCASRPRARPTCSGACGSRSPPSPPITAASPTRACGRCATWSTSGRSFASEDWAAYQDVNARFAAAIHARARSVRRPGLHPGLSPGARRAGVAGPAARHPHRALLAHPVAVPRSPPHLPVAARARRGPARPTT